MKNTLILIILLVLTSSLFAQTDYSDKYKLGLTIGYSYAKSHFIQIGAILGTSYGNIHVPSKGFGIGADIGSVNNKLTIGTKIFYENNFYIVTGFRINAINYFSGQIDDFRLMPQFGFSLFGNINLMYGYSIPALGKEINNIGRHSFSVTFNLFKKDTK